MLQSRIVPIFDRHNYNSLTSHARGLVLGEDNKKNGGSILDGVVTIVNPDGKEVEPRGPGSREYIKNPPDPSRPRTAFDVHSKTEVILKADERPETAPSNPEKKHQERDKKYYTPSSGLGPDIVKSIPTKGKAWQDLALEVIPCTFPPDPAGAASANDGANTDAGVSLVKASPADFIKRFNAFIGDISIDKVMFKSFVNSMVPIPEIDLSKTKKAMEDAAQAPYSTEGGQNTWRQKTSEEEKVLTRYSDIMCEVPESVVSPSVMLFAMVSSVTEVVGKEDPNEHSGIGKNHLGTVGPGTVALQYGDNTTGRIAKGELELSVLSSTSSNLDSKMLVAIERAAFERLEFPRTYGKGSLPLKPLKSEETRGMEKTELLTFSSLSPNDIDRVTQLTSFERLLNGAYEDIYGANNIEPWVLTNRELFEELSPHVLSQVLSNAMLSSPEILRTYHPASDSLLLALHNPTAKGRVGQKFWKPTKQIRHRLPFNDWRLSPRLDATPRTLEASKSGIDVESIFLKKLTTHTMHLFPADHSTICLRTMAAELADAIDDGKTIPRDIVGGKSNSWLSIYHEDHIFGLRHAVRDSPMVGSADASSAINHRRGSKAGNEGKEGDKARWEHYRQTGEFAAHYVCDFEGGVRMLACEGALQKSKKDGFHTITLRQTFPSGLIVSNCSDGVVRQEVVTSAKVGVFGDKIVEEMCRLIFGKGTVVRHMRDGSIHMLFSDGGSAFKKAGETSFTYVSIDDGCMYRKAADPFDGKVEWSKVGTSKNFTKEVDPETKAYIRTIEYDDDSRTRIIENSDGSVLVVHSEGTVVRSAPKVPDEDGVHFVPKILVEAKGMAAVEFDVEVNQQAIAYARGAQVAISKGGDRIRSRTAFPDSSYCLSTFDTRLTSEVCGRLISVRPDRTEIIVSDDGSVLHKVRALWTGNDTYETEQARARGGAKAGDKGGVNYNIKQDPDAQPDPDHVTQCYIFNLIDGKMSTSDKEHNLFEAWLGDIPKSGCVNVELAGVLSLEDTNEGMMKVPAVVNEPIEPRMFVVGRDGSGFEILRKSNIEDWERRLLNEKERIKDLTQGEAENKIERFGDPSDMGSFQREFELRIKYANPADWKGEGTMHNFGTLFARTFDQVWGIPGVVKSWSFTSLPVAAKYSKMKDGDGWKAVVGFEECEVGSIMDRCPEIVMARTWIVHQPLNDEEKKELLRAIEECEQWRMARQNTIDRFSVDDDRDAIMLKAEQSMAKVLKRAYRAAKATKKRERETMLRKQQQQQQQQNGGGGLGAGGGGIGGLTRPAILEEEEEEEDDEDEWDDDDSDEEGKGIVDLESDSYYVEAKGVFMSIANSDGDSDDSDYEGAGEGAVGEDRVDFEGCRAALIQVLGFGVSRDTLKQKLKVSPDLDGNGSKVGFNQFYRILNSLRSEGEMKSGEVLADGKEDDVMHSTTRAWGVNGGGLVEEEGRQEVPSHGAYFKTAEGLQLREKSIAEDTYFPKKKGDIRLLSTEPIPQPAVYIRPKTAEGAIAVTLVGDSNAFADGGITLEGDVESFGDERELNISGVDNVVRDVRTAPTLGGGSMGGNSRSSSPSLSMSIKDLKAVAATGSGRNAVRAQSILDKEDGVRLRAGERPADMTIYGEDRVRPVRVVDRAKGVTNQNYQRLDKESVSGRNTPDVSLRSMSPSPPPLISASNTMEVIPECLNFGFCKKGDSLVGTVSVNNIGVKNCRYDFSLEGGGDGYDFDILEVPRGVVAAGIREQVVVKLVCTDVGEIKGKLVISSQFDVSEVRLLGNIVEDDEWKVAKKKRSRQVSLLG